MNNIIFSLYIDIPENELDYQPPHHGSKISKTLHTKQQLKKYYDWLKEMQVKYAKSIDVEYKLFEYDDEYKSYHKWFKETYPQITSYNIVNFYKLKKLHDLVETHDNVLYLDFDVVPISKINFFNCNDLSKGIHILTGTTETQNEVSLGTDIIIESNRIKKYGISHSIRSPTAKYWNARALCLNEDIFGDYTVYNTGIIGVNKFYLDKLNYFKNFDLMIKKMDILIDNCDMFPDYIKELFAYDNETIWAYKTLKYQVETIKLKSDWHHFMDKWNYIPHTVNFVHAINKNFGYVKNYYEKNCI